MTGAPVRKWGRIAVVVALLVLALMWIYVLFVGNPVNEDKLHDTAFATAAEPVCKATLDELSAIGVVNQVADSPQQRAVLVDKADTELRKMVEKLRQIDVPNQEDATAVSLWLADWDQWLADRAAWLDQLERGEDVPFNEKQREDTRAPNSKALNDFAQVNLMRSCATPGGI